MASMSHFILARSISGKLELQLALASAIQRPPSAMSDAPLKRPAGSITEAAPAEEPLAEAVETASAQASPAAQPAAQRVAAAGVQDAIQIHFSCLEYLFSRISQCVSC